MIPTRRRPDGVAKAVASVIALAEKPQLLEIVIGADDDDPTAQELPKLFKNTPQVRVLIGKRHDTLGALCDTMAAATTGDIIGCIVDDIVFDVKDWDRSTRATLDSRPMHIAHPFDPQVGAYFVGEPFVTRRLYEFLKKVQGFYFPPYFPYWFNDTWFTEIGAMSGLKIQMAWSVPLNKERPGTIGLRDLKFWAQFFDATRPIRMRAAKAMVEEWFPQDTRAAFVAEIPRLARNCEAAVAHLQQPEFVAFWEGQHDGPDDNERHIRARRVADDLLKKLASEKV
jgi:hypothetical protein